MDISELRTDPKAEAEGVDVDYGGGLKLKIARINNPRAQEMTRHLVRAMAPSLRAGEDAEDEYIREKVAVEHKVVARCVLVGWSGMFDRSFDPPREVPYTPDQALRMFDDEAYHDFYDFVVGAASRVDRYREKQKGQALGNSPNGSAGS